MDSDERTDGKLLDVGSNRISNFAYQPLNVANSEIRLVRLRANESLEDDLDVELYHVSLDAQPEYVACSYTWGEASKQVSIRVNGQPFNITANLASLLKALRRSTAKEVISVWADAICINQGDVAERNLQVRRMKSIYERALQVIGWLQPEEDDLDTIQVAVQAIRDVWNFYVMYQQHQNPEVLATGSGKVEVPARSLLACVALLALDLLGSNTGDLWEAWATMFARPWWRRTWVIQECCSASSLGIMYGPNSGVLPWVQLSFSLAFVRHYATDPEYAHSPVRTLISRVWEAAQPAHAIFRATQARDLRMPHSFDIQQPPPERSALELYRLLDQFRSFDATLPHDKVYGLLGLAEGAEDVELDPDYSLPFAIMYGNLVKHRVRKYKVLDVLGYANGIMNLANGVPSWIPDWRFGNDRDLIFNSLDSDGKCVFNASGTSQPEVRFSPDSRTLSVQGFVLSTIEVMGQLPKPEEDFYATVQSSWEEILGTVPEPYHSGESHWSAYMRTLFMDSELIDGIDMYYTVTKRETRAQETWQAPTPHNDGTEDLETKQKAHARQHFNVGYSFGKSTDGYMGMFPFGTKKGDRICVLFGGHTPFILRPCDGTHHYYIGECYAHGFMDGETMQLLGHGKTNAETFTIH
ncbi:hypothetical protein MMC30_003329 [Trapelia coarctata]|nr:hypothetical protein [Trapelia coarctata]